MKCDHRTRIQEALEPVELRHPQLHQGVKEQEVDGLGRYEVHGLDLVDPYGQTLAQPSRPVHGALVYLARVELAVPVVL